MSQTTVQRAADNVRRAQTPLQLRKESLSALAALLVWVATIIAENIDSIPLDGTAGQIIGVVASAVAYGVARFTVPALTKGQEQKLIAEAERVETAEKEATAPLTLPTYTFASTAEAHHAD